MEQLLDGKEIVKSYGEGREKQLVLDHVSLEMERGGFVSVMGPSGSGKSTLLYTLSGMDSDYSGTVVFDGKEEGDDLDIRAEKVMRRMRQIGI